MFVARSAPAPGARGAGCQMPAGGQGGGGQRAGAAPCLLPLSCSQGRESAERSASATAFAQGSSTHGL